MSSNLVVVITEDGKHFQVFRHDGQNAPVEVTSEYQMTWSQMPAPADAAEVLFGFHVGKMIPRASLVTSVPV